MSFNDVAIVSIKGTDYRINFWYMSKDDAISVMHNSNLIDKKSRQIWNEDKCRCECKEDLINKMVCDKG